MIRKGICLMITSLAISCAPFSQEMRKQADEVLSVQEVQKYPDRYLKTVVLWGGVLLEITNNKNMTEMKVLKTKLDFQTKPTDLDQSEGRFIVRAKGFLDPAVYTRGRLITVIGEISGLEKLPIGNSVYPYPVVLAREVHLWEAGEYHGRRPPPYWYSPYWWPYFPTWPGYPEHSPLIYWP
ncbi:MAG: Slp family lipoprotein [Syntrophales bacterium]